MFSLFYTEENNLFSCGLNDKNQLGIDKNPLKIILKPIDSHRPHKIN